MCVFVCVCCVHGVCGACVHGVYIQGVCVCVCVCVCVHFAHTLVCMHWTD